MSHESAARQIARLCETFGGMSGKRFAGGPKVRAAGFYFQISGSLTDARLGLVEQMDAGARQIHGPACVGFSDIDTPMSCSYAVNPESGLMKPDSMFLG